MERAVVALLAEEEDVGRAEEEPGVIGVRGLFEKGGGPEGVDLLLVVEPAVFVKIFAFSKLANEGCDMDAGACALVGEAKGSLALTEELPVCPPSRSANKQNKAEDFVVEFLPPALALDAAFWDEEVFGRETETLAVDPAAVPPPPPPPPPACPPPPPAATVAAAASEDDDDDDSPPAPMPPPPAALLEVSLLGVEALEELALDV